MDRKIDKPKCVGTDDADSIFICQRSYFILEPAGSSASLNPPVIRTMPFILFRAQSSIANRRGWHNGDGQVNFLIYLSERGIGRKSPNLRRARIYEKMA
ncbi:hypothetical protein M1O14_02595 [Dehalococcoidia bacterium]|nr:hypothetical protein [Dehalococcoidia bacterium]MCL0082591.1 hypothetical protein [Dehalococcoidia bacterium]